MLKLLYDRIVFEPHKMEKSQGGIIISNIEEKLMKGTVIYTGPGHWEFGNFVEMSVKPGDIIIYNNIAANDIMDGDKKYKVIREPEVVAIYTSDNN